MPHRLLLYPILHHPHHSRISNISVRVRRRQISCPVIHLHGLWRSLPLRGNLLHPSILPVCPWRQRDRSSRPAPPLRLLLHRGNPAMRLLDAQNRLLHSLVPGQRHLHHYRRVFNVHDARRHSHRQHLWLFRHLWPRDGNDTSRIRRRPDIGSTTPGRRGYKFHEHLAVPEPAPGPHHRQRHLPAADL